MAKEKTALRSGFVEIGAWEEVLEFFSVEVKEMEKREKWKRGCNGRDTMSKIARQLFQIMS